MPTQQPAKKKSSTPPLAKATPEGAAATVAKKVVSRPKPKSSGPRLSGAHGRKWLLAELVVCVLLLTLAGMTGQASADGTQTDTGSRLAVKGSALAGVFIVLGLVSAGGKGAEKTAGALGLMITLAYMFNEREVFTTLSAWAKSAGAP